jgi:hypothetical protein
MYAQRENPKENQNRIAVNSVTQKKSKIKQDLKFADNRFWDNRIGEVVQTKLIINSWKAGYSDRIKGTLDRLLGGIDNALAYENSWITPVLRLIGLTSSTNVIKGENYEQAGNDKPRSTELVGRLIDSAKTVYIQEGENQTAPMTEGNETVNETLTAASFGEEAGVAREGRNARVNINAETFEGRSLHNLSSVPVNNDGALEREETPNQILLGHELIHADRITRGVSASRGTSRYHHGFGEHNYPHERYNGEGIYEGGATAKEDIFNIGLTPQDEEVVNPDEDPITENDLRDEHGLHRRVGY